MIEIPPMAADLLSLGELSAASFAVGDGFELVVGATGDGSDVFRCLVILV